ncbi:MAG: MBL fold metallo-hydrolase [Caldisphaera sp.]|jgi:L-ascorbate metabolism protein UlaG (beta-lactamase superfamily)|nr:MAG: hypothetical protein C0201_00040 [Caldisphaera sp.]
MRITWCGNSYFIIENNGIKIAVDPHDGGSLNLVKCKVSADYIIVTHNHYDHNAIKIVMGNQTKNIIKNPVNKTYSLNGMELNFFQFNHDNFDGNLFGKVYAFKFKINDLVLANLSDIGEKFNENKMRDFINVDILMIPVGGVTTIDYLEAQKYIDYLKPKMVIPMHYWIYGSTLPYDSIDNFLKISKYEIIHINENFIDINELNFKDKTKIIVFNSKLLSLEK